MSTQPFVPPANLPERLLQTPMVDPQSGIVTSLPWKTLFSRMAQPVQVPTLTQDTHANRLNFAASKVVAGSIFYETDRSVYYIAVGGQWIYGGGMSPVFQVTIPSDLTASDAGFLADVQDYGHLLRWDGKMWGWGPGDAQSGYSVAFVNAPKDPLWHLCDGSTNVPYLRADGGLSYATLPSTAGSYFRQ